LGGVGIASHGVDRAQGALDIEARSMRAGMAVISFDFSKTASWPITSPLSVAKADTRCRGLRVGLSIVAAARGLAVNRHKAELVRPASCDPG